MTNTQFQKLEEIKLIPVPASVNNNRGYQAVPHIDVIDSIKEQLDKKGLGVVREVYKTSKGGNLIYGSILTDMKSSDELGGGLHFINSYDKSKQLEVKSGSIIYLCDNGQIRMQTMASTKRKHIGSILFDLDSIVEYAIETLEVEYMELIKDNNLFKSIGLGKPIQAELAGRLFMEEQLLSVTQMSLLKKELYKTEGNFLGNTAYDFYNNVTESLKLSHPADYISDHAKFHQFMIEGFV